MGSTKGVGADLVPQDGGTLLLVSASKGHEAVARLFLDAGVDKNATDKVGTVARVGRC